MNRRQQALENLRKHATDGNNVACIRALFEVIVGLPEAIQLELARREMLFRFELFVNECEGCHAMQELLDDPENYFQTHERGNPCTLYEVSMDCQVYFDSIDGILLAYSRREDQFILSASCTYAIFSVVIAAKINELKYKNKKLYDILTENGYFSHEEEIIYREFSKKFYQKEWTRIANFLCTLNISAYEDMVDIYQMRIAFDKWEKRGQLTLPLDMIALNKSLKFNDMCD